MKKLLIVLCCILALQSCNNGSTGTETVNGFDINWSGDLNKKEQDAVKEMISNMVKVEAGTFYMGAQKDSVIYNNYDENATSLESPVHEVTVGEFYINKYEVTQNLWKAIMGKHNDRVDEFDQWEDEFGKGDNYPAYRITFKEVETFISKLNECTGLNFALPTEAQWEWAAIGGIKSNNYTFSGSNNVAEVAAVNGELNEVAKLKANELGIYDMTGNVEEWTANKYGKYSATESTDPVGPTSGSDYVTRGGHYEYGADADLLNVKSRNKIKGTDASYVRGLRLILEEPLPTELLK